RLRSSRRIDPTCCRTPTATTVLSATGCWQTKLRRPESRCADAPRGGSAATTSGTPPPGSSRARTGSAPARRVTTTSLNATSLLKREVPLSSGRATAEKPLLLEAVHLDLAGDVDAVVAAERGVMHVVVHEDLGRAGIRVDPQQRPTTGRIQAALALPGEQGGLPAPGVAEGEIGGDAVHHGPGRGIEGEHGPLTGQTPEQPVGTEGELWDHLRVRH